MPSVTPERPQDFTSKNREWFGKRYDFGSSGIYFPHQPVYGFSRFKEHVLNYCRTYNILRMMEELEFTSFLDVGSAEGYFVDLVSRLFRVRAYGSDLAESGLRRMRELYGHLGATADAQFLPFRDRAFDLVLCSETLEHVADPASVIRELMRVCNKYLIITTPAARSEAALRAHFEHLDPNLIFGHFHFFTEAQMREWLPRETVFEGLGHRRMQRAYQWFYSGYEQDEVLRGLLGFIRESCPEASPETFRRYEAELGELTNPRVRWRTKLAGPHSLMLVLMLDQWLSRLRPRETAAFLTLTPCHGTPLVRRRRPVPGLLRHLLIENRVDPLRLAPILGAPAAG